ncbi:type II toxin-antitoxin system VapC family toxin [Rhizobium halophytocola]|uniref:Ribonuclease VapC n=1 Tax=Rhizobium halophytocola TaxID=735519 RepID=A0ABS4DYM4_9HYPH|nr:type II toxin-antitoxin system VapC family toxin [Rhizobium halophytocola]MBP1850791.1 tRNA(fMet)-specific endonuclease VapC [Rhizobium halophytocola]
MLDTNIISDVIRHPDGNPSKRWTALGDDALSISAIVASELRFGVLKRGSARLRAILEELLSRIQILPYEAEASYHFAEIRHALERVGKPIGATDLFIAAHARSLDLTVVTANIREFNRVPDLKVENWLEDTP